MHADAVSAGGLGRQPLKRGAVVLGISIRCCLAFDQLTAGREKVGHTSVARQTASTALSLLQTHRTFLVFSSVTYRIILERKASS